MATCAPSTHGHHSVALLPVGLLITAALIQFPLTRAWSLTPWKGGGFGMFSTIDSREARFLRVYLLRRGDDARAYEVPVAFPSRGAPKLNTLAIAVRAAPGRDAAIVELARTLLSMHWSEYEGEAAHRAWRSTGVDFKPRDANALEAGSGASHVSARFVLAAGTLPASIPAARTLAIGALRVEVWRYTFDAAHGRVTASCIVSYTHARPDWR